MSELVPSSPDEHVRQIDELTEAFFQSRKSEHTRAAYRKDIRSWWDWCLHRRLNPLKARPADILVWLADLQAGREPFTRPEAGTTRARRVAAVSSWYRWLIRHDAAERNPVVLDPNERPTKAPRPAPGLSDDQAEKLLAAADADRSPRTAAMVWLMLTTGVRVGELCAADTADVGMDRGVTVLHVRGKGGKTRPVEIVPPAWVRLNAYLESRRDVQRLPVPQDQAGAGERKPLIATDTGKRIDRKEPWRVLRRLAQVAGLPSELAGFLCPHSTRATFVTSALEDEAPIRDIQRTVGHASPVTTQGYDRSLYTADRSPGRRVARRFHADRLDAQRAEQQQTLSPSPEEETSE